MNNKRIIIISCIICVLLGFGLYFNVNEKIVDTLGERTLTWGSRGSDVSELQSKLNNLGIYAGPVDGIYGPLTAAGVRNFQRSNDLNIDGIAGSKTISVLLSSSRATTASGNNWALLRNQDDVRLLARVIYGEARGEPYVGQVAIAAVVLNRVKHPSFPNTIPGVVFQPGAFTAVSDGQIWLNVSGTARQAANDALNGWDPTGGALYYWNPATATSRWIWSRTIWFRIGKHVFGS